MDRQTRKRISRVHAHFTDEEHGAQRSTGLDKVARELGREICGVSRGLVVLHRQWWNKTPHPPRRILSVQKRPPGRAQETASEWPHPSWGPSGKLTPLKPSAQPYSFLKKLWPGAMPVFQSAFFQPVHTVLTKLNMPRPGGGPGIAGS